MVRARTGANSKQDYMTPPDFMSAIHSRFGAPYFDLAAGPTNTQAGQYYCSPDEHNPFGDRRCRGVESLSRSWAMALYDKAPLVAIGWLNPPFIKAYAFAEKCASEAPKLVQDSKILLLVPASVGSNWYRDHVHRQADVLFLNGRISFDNNNNFGKDCMLCVFHAKQTGLIDVWNWRLDQVNSQ